MAETAKDSELNWDELKPQLIRMAFELGPLVVFYLGFTFGNRIIAGFPAFSFVVDAQLALQFNFYSSEPVVTPGRYVPKEEDEEPK